MAVGMTPIIPLYRVQPDPDARFQRFGVNDSQFVGKPMVTFATEARLSQPQQTVTRTPTPAAQQQETLEGNRGAGVEQSRALGSTAPEPTYGYSGRSGTSLGTGASPKPGSYLELKA